MKDPRSENFNRALNSFFDATVRPLCAAGLGPLTEETESPEARLKQLLDEFKTQPEWADSLVAQVNRGRDEPLGLEQCIRISGVENIRNQVLLEKLADVIPVKLLERDKNSGRVQAAPSAIFKFAFKAQETFSAQMRHREVAFVTGLVFDLLAIQISRVQDPMARKKLSELLNDGYRQGVQVAKVALQLGRARKELSLEKHAISFSLLNQASFVAMAMQYPEYADFLAKCRAENVPPSFQDLAEERVYGGTHSFFAVLLAWPFTAFGELSDAILYHNKPYLLYEKGKTDRHDVAAVTFLAHFLWSNKARFTERKALEAKKLRPELLHFELSFDPVSVIAAGGI